MLNNLLTLKGGEINELCETTSCKCLELIEQDFNNMIYNSKYLIVVFQIKQWFLEILTIFFGEILFL